MQMCTIVYPCHLVSSFCNQSSTVAKKRKTSWHQAILIPRFDTRILPTLYLVAQSFLEVRAAVEMSAPSGSAPDGAVGLEDGSNVYDRREIEEGSAANGSTSRSGRKKKNKEVTAGRQRLLHGTIAPPASTTPQSRPRKRPPSPGAILQGAAAADLAGVINGGSQTHVSESIARTSPLLPMFALGIASQSSASPGTAVTTPGTGPPPAAVLTTGDMVPRHLHPTDTRGTGNGNPFVVGDSGLQVLLALRHLQLVLVVVLRDLRLIRRLGNLLLMLQYVSKSMT